MEQTATTVAQEILGIEGLVGDLDKRLRRLVARAEADREQLADGSSEAKEFVGKALESIMDSVRKTGTDVGASVASETTRVGSNTARTVAEEVEGRPLTMLALAAGVGFLIGIVSRR